MSDERRPLFHFVKPKLSRVTEPHERDSLLLLEDPSFRSHMVEALDEVNNSAAIRRDFVRDPVGTSVRTFMPEHLHHLADRELSDANKLVMSTVTNKRFHEWMDDYQRKLLEAHEKDDDPLRSVVEDKNRILQDLAEALISYGDATLLKNLLEAASSSGRVTADELRRRGGTRIPLPFPTPEDPPDLPDRPRGPRPDPMPDVGIVKVVVVVVVAVAIAIAVVAVAADSDHHTVDSDFRNISGPQFRSLAEQLVRHAAKLEQAGLLADIDARIQ